METHANVTLEMVYMKLLNIEKEVMEINEDLHRIKPEFAEKLEKIEKEKTHTFRTIGEMEKHMDEMED